MAAAFLKIVNMSLTASWLILAVLLLRQLLRKVPRWIHCILWAMVAVRLVCPFTIESAVSLLPSSRPLSEEIISDDAFPVNTEMQVIKMPVNTNLNAYSPTDNPAPAAAVNREYIFINILAVIWLLGITIMLLYSLISYYRVYRRTGASIRVYDNIFQCDAIDTPFILGIVRPRIYLPSTLQETQTEYVVAHEKAHIKRHDHWWKPLGFLILSVYWFNPLCWISYILLCRDIEQACDERVIRTMDIESKKSYAKALLACSVREKVITACPLAFGEVGVRKRITSVLNYKKPAFWIMIAAVAACAAVAVCFLTSPRQKEYLEPLLPPAREIQTVSLQNDIDGADSLRQTQDRELIGKIMEILTAAELTNRSSIQDYPQTDSEVSQINLLSYDETKNTFFYYEESGTAYIEKPYQGIYRTSPELLALLSQAETVTEAGNASDPGAAGGREGTTAADNQGEPTDPGAAENPGENADNWKTAGFTYEELCRMATDYYVAKSNAGQAPAFVEVDSVLEDGMILIHLYDMAEGRRVTRDWYTVDRITAKGYNVLSEDIDLTETITDPEASRKVLLFRTMEEWAQAFVNRDGEMIADMASLELISDLQDRDLLMGSQGHYRFGISSPWPEDSATDYSLYQYNDTQAEIYYYARTSGSHITCWKELLTYRWDGGEYSITGEQLTYFDNISTGAAFEEAYHGYIDGTMIDYTQNGLGEALNDSAYNAVNGANASAYEYDALFSPETAAVTLLNLSHDPEQIQITHHGIDTSGLVGLDITFLQDQATVTISMVQPYGKNGIWVPADYHVDVLARFMGVDWAEVEKLTFDDSVDTINRLDITKILCIGEIPEHDIKVYGYGDEDTFGSGVAIDIKGDVNYFDWLYMLRFNRSYPELYWDETNRRLQIAFHTNEGTGIHADNLYVLQAYDTGTLVPSNFDLENYSAMLRERLGYTFDEETKKLTLIDQETGKALETIDIPEGKVTGLYLGGISHFELGETIILHVTPEYLLEGYGIPWYGDMLKFEVIMEPAENGEFTFRLGKLLQ